jgi:hypothetical protein
MLKLLTAILLALTISCPARATQSSLPHNLPFNQSLSELLEEPPTLQLVYNENTEVLLDRRPCRVEDLPPECEVILLELARDRKTVLKLHLRSKRPSSK